jgi:hypothetical protein
MKNQITPARVSAQTIPYYLTIVRHESECGDCPVSFELNLLRNDGLWTSRAVVEESQLLQAEADFRLMVFAPRLLAILKSIDQSGGYVGIDRDAARAVIAEVEGR